MKKIRKAALIFILALALFKTSFGANPYTPFIKGHKKLGFKPTAKFNNEILWVIRNKYPIPVSDEQVFSGAKRELMTLLKAYNIDPTPFAKTPANSKILINFLKRYRKKVSQSLAIYAAGVGMVKSLKDPESTIILPSVSKNPRRDIIPEGYGGIGVLIEKRQGKLMVIEAFKGAPSQKAGIVAGDVILKINGASTKNMDIEKAMNMLRGKIGTSVNLVINHRGKIIRKKIVRSNVEVQPVSAGILAGKIGYIKIVFFGEKYPKTMYEIVKRFEKKGIKYWILDLRDNAGGALNNLIVASSLFVPSEKPIMFIKYKDKNKKFKSIARKNIPPPVAIIVNRYTTGSAEILAQTIKDYNGSVIFGERTGGNAAVSEFIKLSDGATLRVTVGFMVSGKGKKVHKIGIKPDYPIKGANNPANTEYILRKVVKVITSNIK